jgi:hypothetical protein
VLATRYSRTETPRLGGRTPGTPWHRGTVAQPPRCPGAGMAAPATPAATLADGPQTLMDTGLAYPPRAPADAVSDASGSRRQAQSQADVVALTGAATRPPIASAVVRGSSVASSDTVTHEARFGSRRPSCRSSRIASHGRPVSRVHRKIPPPYYVCGEDFLLRREFDLSSVARLRWRGRGPDSTSRRRGAESPPCAAVA